MSRRARSLIPILVTALLAGPAVAPARAQDPLYTLTLVTQRFSHGADDPLDVGIKVTNLSETPLEGFRLQISSYERVTTRSALEESFDGDPFGSPTGVTFEEFAGVVTPGDSRTVVLKTPVSGLATFEAGTGGVYPLGVDLADTSGVPLSASVVTEVIYYPGEPLETQLSTVLVAPLNDVATRGPDGVFAESEDGVVPLEQAVAEEGWLRGTLDAMTGAADEGLHFALAPTPRLVEELADMSDGYTRRSDDGTEEEVSRDAPAAQAAAAVLDRLTKLLDTNGVQPLLVPYSFADLPALAHIDAPSPGPIARQLTVAEEALAGLELRKSGFTRRWVFPPAGRMDGRALTELRALSAETGTRTFFTAESLVQPVDPALAGCPEGSQTFACPVAVGGTVGYEADPGLQERFIALAQPGEDRLDLQRLLAETAMIREELPGRTDRVIQATMPSLWHPRPKLARLMFHAFARAPWLSMLTPNQGLDRAAAPVERQPVSLIEDLPHAPDASYFDDLADAEDVVDDLRDVGAPEGLVTRLERDILVAYGRTWWSDTELAGVGAAFAQEARDEAEAHLGRIAIHAAPEITMTSRSTDVQFLVSNDNEYPVRLDVDLDSPNLIVDDLRVPAEFPPDATTPVQASVAAQTSGIFQVELSATTPSGSVVDQLVISVRSTELNQIALGLTLGALAFLISFYAYRAVRRRRRAREEQAAGTA